MWLPNSKGTNPERKGGGGNRLVAVAIDKDNKGCQYALKWAIDHLVNRGQTLVLIHVLHRPSGGNNAAVCDFNGALTANKQLDKQTKELFLTFHCFCTRKDVQCIDIVLEDKDIVKALTEYVSHAAIEDLVLGASSRHGFIKKFKFSDVPSNVSKGAPDFCTVYVISKSKISSVRNASRSVTFVSPLHSQIQNQLNNNASTVDARPSHSLRLNVSASQRTPRRPPNLPENGETFK